MKVVSRHYTVVSLSTLLLTLSFPAEAQQSNKVPGESSDFAREAARQIAIQFVERHVASVD
jgi:hypothetical protein